MSSDYLILFIGITVAFNSSIYSGAEADGIIPVTVVTTGTASIPYTVIITPLESDPRSAASEVDFSNETLEVTFNPGETEKTVNILINPDCLREGSEFFNLSLSLSSDTSNPAIGLGDPNGAVAEIEDTDSKHIVLQQYTACLFTYPFYVQYMNPLLHILAVIYVNFSQALYTAEEEDRIMILTLEADMVSIWPFSIEVIPIQIDGSSMLTTCTVPTV